MLQDVFLLEAVGHEYIVSCAIKEQVEAWMGQLYCVCKAMPCANSVNIMGLQYDDHT